MSNNNKPSISLYVLLGTSMSGILVGIQSFAGGLLAPKDSAAIHKFSHQLSTLTTREENKFFEIKNAKGELIAVPRIENNAKQENLWSQMDPAQDRAEGTATQKAYKAFKLPQTGNTVIVAVIDSGVDTKHPDLQGKIWVNKKEIAGNGIDDDKNGYVDDINGWNFLGNKKGENVSANTLEVTREVVRLEKKQKEGKLTEAEKKLLAKVSAEHAAKKTETQQILDLYISFDKAITLLKKNGLKEETVSGLDAVTSTDEDVIAAKKLVARLYARKRDSIFVKRIIADQKEALDFHYSKTFDSSTIVGDNPMKMNEVGYGNNDVMGPDSSHGTHVSGIIAANRDNDYGVDGQASNVLIMSLRAVPNGDERDKDVANAIRYAVNNGAKIINGSFGKPYSPKKSYVDSAVLYAQDRGVLIVHAAGNDGKNTEAFDNNFPNARMLASRKRALNWIEVGASSKEKGLTLPAEFSNWGKSSVDIFAPGVDIVSTTPGNTYASFIGTSMASPEVAGVAAIVMNRFPKISPAQLRVVLMKTSTQYGSLQVNQPSDGEESKEVLFSTLSASGGIVNTYGALNKLIKQ